MQPPAGFGCIDTKVSPPTLGSSNYYSAHHSMMQVTDYSMALSMTSVVENGPTHQVPV